ncbi:MULTISPECIES: hypothetical protein [unclassified Pseudoxanthomonas]|uniref:hypothetical protein n=1 Tax=unclassified Pseudoxanthomonas TaxID=2645906 RepID=UPI00161E51C5|nr:MULTISPECIES: hypothetical protein [unclassified Pseudoxanthomonas]MBV7472779.1 hypothetical protein [Pseudoxanthomonas sp. PXM05]
MFVIYRALTVVLLSILLVWFFFPWGFAYVGEAKYALAWLGVNSVVDREVIVAYSNVVVVAYVVLYVGLFFYINVARYGFVLLVMLVGLASPLLGLSVQSGYEAMFGYFQTIGDGMVLAMSFFTGVANRFKEGRNKKMDN